MYIKQLEINNFRRFESQRFTFSPRLNLLLGQNAQGKTTILEAIHLLCLARSFRTRSDHDLYNFSKESYQLLGVFVTDDHIEKKVGIIYKEGIGRSIAIGGKKLLKYSDLIGNFPTISLSSQDYHITTGSPSDRRHFADLLLCQLSSRYLAKLKTYYKILKQRNQILQNLSKGKEVYSNEIDVWNSQLIETGCEIIKARSVLCDDFSVLLDDFYQIVSGTKATLKIQYRPQVEFKNNNDIIHNFYALLKNITKREIKFGHTLIGPHRDDFTFLIDDRDLKIYGSQGEHKSAVIAIKAAETAIIKRRKRENPILLLDDLFSDLDAERSFNAINCLMNGYQIFITSTFLSKKELDFFSQKSRKNIDIIKFENDKIAFEQFIHE